MTTRRSILSFAAALTAGLIVVAVPVSVDPLVAAPEQREVDQAEIPLKVDVVITRSKGTSVVGSLPFTLYLNARERPGGSYVRMRMGVDVPVGTRTTTESPPADSSRSSTTTTSTKPEYRYVGTSIDCQALAIPDGAFRLTVNVQDSAIHTVAGETAVPGPDAMAFRTFSMSNILDVRPGEKKEFGSATDRITGETVRVEVIVSVVK